MKKTFDAVKFQRQRRAALSKKLATMTTREIVEHFKRVNPPTMKAKRTVRHSA